jgi:cytochrome c oxidase assembly protein subunit 20
METALHLARRVSTHAMIGSANSKSSPLSIYKLRSRPNLCFTTINISATNPTNNSITTMAGDTRDAPAPLSSTDPVRSSSHSETPRLYRPDSPTDDESDRPKRKTPVRNPEFPQTQVGKLWAELGNPADPANTMPGGTYNSAGGKPKEVTLWGTIQTFPQDLGNVKLEEFRNIHRLPCAREGLMYGIGAGFGFGGLRAILGGNVWRSCNWAVGGFTVMAAGSFAWCQRSLEKEKRDMRKVVEAMRARQLEQARVEREEAQKKKEMERLAEEERLRKSWTRWQNYRFW